jgi:hypothetical protein
MAKRKIVASNPIPQKQRYKWGQLWNWDRELGFFRSEKSSYTPVNRGSYLGLRKRSTGSKRAKKSRGLY